MDKEGKGQKNENRQLYWILSITGFLCLLIIGWYMLSMKGTYYFSCASDAAINGQIGDFIGGTIGTILSFASFYLIYLTLKKQSEFNNYMLIFNFKSDIKTFYKDEMNEINLRNNNFFINGLFKNKILNDSLIIISCEKNNLIDENKIKEIKDYYGINYSLINKYIEIIEEILEKIDDINSVLKSNKIKKNTDLFIDLKTLKQLEIIYSYLEIYETKNKLIKLINNIEKTRSYD